MRLRYAAFMQGLRDAIDARIRSRLDGDERAIATALLTGRRDAITTPVNDAMFISGLGHVLSISGYHMAVVAGVVFFAVRALLALIPALTVSFPIKKWSAAAALAAAAFYLLLSGAEVATQRSFFMTAVVLIAVMVDRRAITFRTLAVAAMIVLAIAPEALVHPSFQMSFAATLGLVALVQIGMPHLFATPDHSTTARVALWGGRELVDAASGLAGRGARDHALCRLPFPSRHALWRARQSRGDAGGFGAGDAGGPARPRRHAFRLRRLLLVADGDRHRLDDRGDAMGRRTCPVPSAASRRSASVPLIASSCGLILMGLLRTPLRWSGAIVLAASIVWALAVRAAGYSVSGDGRATAVRGKDGRLHLMRTTKDAVPRQGVAGGGCGRAQRGRCLACRRRLLR